MEDQRFVDLRDEDFFVPVAFLVPPLFFEDDFFDEDFLLEVFFEVDFLAVDFFEVLFFDDDFFADDFFDGAFFADDFFDEDLREGTLSPSARASEMPMAMACLRLFTFCPDPLFNFPEPYSCITFETFFCALAPYVAMESSLCTRYCALRVPAHFENFREG